MQYTALDDVQISREGWVQRGHSPVKHKGLILALCVCFVHVGCFAQRYGAFDVFHRRVLGDLWSRYTHCEKRRSSTANLCTISLHGGMGQSFSSGVNVCMNV